MSTETDQLHPAGKDVGTRGSLAGEPSVRAIRAVQIAALISLMAAASLILRKSSSLPDVPFCDDSFYMLSVSRSIGLGHGITIDGVAQTNGFQPLFTFICSLAFGLTKSDAMAIRIVVLLHFASFAAAAVLLGLIVRDSIKAGAKSASARFAFWVTVALYSGSTVLLFQHFNGLETGWLLFMYTLCWRYYQKTGATSAGQAVIFGALLGLTVLTRIDAAFLVAILCAYFLLPTGEPFRKRLVRALTVGAVAVIVSSPWWIFNVTRFGSLMPISGRAEQHWAFDPYRWVRAASAILLQTVPQLYFGDHGKWPLHLFRIAVIVCAVGIAAGLIRKLRRSSGVEFSRAMAFLGCLLVTAILFVFWYTASSWAAHFYFRYFSPLALIFLTVIAMAVCRVSPRGGIAVGIVLLTTAIMLVTVTCLQSGRLYGQPMLATDRLRMVERYVPQDAKVAAGQSGVLGFFRPRVVNLDGKVNPHAPQGVAAVSDYLNSLDIHWFCDNDTYCNALLGAKPEAGGWTKVADDGFDLLYHRTGHAKPDRPGP